jgi:hypothetical protein
MGLVRQLRKYHAYVYQPLQRVLGPLHHIAISNISQVSLTALFMSWLWFIFNTGNITSVGRSKPWQQNRSVLHYLLPDTGEPKSNIEQWYYALKIVERRANVKANFDFTDRAEDAPPPVGRFSNYGSMIAHIREKAYNNWTVYEATDNM